MAPKTAAPVTEKGFVNDQASWVGWGWPGDQFETNPECAWPNSIWTYNRMAREDARVASVLRAMWLPVLRTGWRISPNGARPEVVKHVAACLGLPIEGQDDNEPTPRTGEDGPADARPATRSKGRFSWSKHLQLALKAQQYGHAVFELNYTIKDGRAYLQKLAPRPQSTIAYFNVDRSGDLISVQQYPAGTFQAPGMLVMTAAPMGDAIPADRLVVYLRDPDPGVWTGNSILRPAFKHWKLKDEMMRVEAAAIRRHGIGVPAINASPEESQDQERLNHYQKIASAYRGGETAGLSLPSGATFQILSPIGSPIDPRRAIEYHDHAIAMVALAHFLNLDSKGGSYALASVQADTFVQSVQTVANDVRDTTQAYVVEDIVNWNWGTDEPAPLLVCDEIGSRQDATAAALQMLVAAGLIRPDPRLEQFLRQAAGLPAPDPDAEDEDDDEEAPEPDQAEPKPQPQPPKPAAAPKNQPHTGSGRVTVREHTRRTAGAPRDEQEPLF